VLILIAVFVVAVCHIATAIFAAKIAATAAIFCYFCYFFCYCCWSAAIALAAS
jgi:hypothetical protein